MHQFYNLDKGSSFDEIKEISLKRVTLQIDLLSICKNQCWYCDIQKNKKLIMNDKTFQLCLDFIARHPQYDFSVTFSGGDPLHLPYETLLDKIDQTKSIENVYSITIATALKGANEQFFNVDDLNFMVTYHAHLWEPEEFIEMLQKIDKFTRVFILIPLDYELAKKSYQVVEAIKNKYIYWLQTIHNPLNDVNLKYDSRVIELFAPMQTQKNMILDGEAVSSYDLIKSNRNSFFDWFCLNNAYNISPDGMLVQDCYLSGWEKITNKTMIEVKAVKCPNKLCITAGEISTVAWKE